MKYGFTKVINNKKANVVENLGHYFEKFDCYSKH